MHPGPSLTNGDGLWGPPSCITISPAHLLHALHIRLILEFKFRLEPVQHLQQIVCVCGKGGRGGEGVVEGSEEGFVELDFVCENGQLVVAFSAFAVDFSLFPAHHRALVDIWAGEREWIEEEGGGREKGMGRNKFEIRLLISVSPPPNSLFTGTQSLRRRLAQYYPTCCS